MTATPDRVDVAALEVAAYTVPTDFPEADGTLHWEKTTMLVVHLKGGGRRGIGYAYTNEAAAKIVEGVLKSRVIGADAMDIPAIWRAMCGAVRNVGRPGLCAGAISAADSALWDLKAKLLGIPLVKLLGRAHSGSTSTAVAASPPIRPSGWRSSWAAGSRVASAA